MSKLVVKDLERIKNGKLVRYNLLIKEPFTSFVVLDKVQNEIMEFNSTRFQLLKEFRDNMNYDLEWKKGSKIDSTYWVSFVPTKLFLNDYLTLKIPTALGESFYLFDKNGLVLSKERITKELKEKSNVIMPYISKLLNVKENSNILDNAFYEDYPIFNSKYEKVLNINGNGITLPFEDYTDLDNCQDILHYYYTYQNEILKNIIIPNTDTLNNYKMNISKEKVLKLYKGEK